MTTNHALMVEAYIEAMQWATTDSNDIYFDQYELSVQACAAAAETCTRFIASHSETMEKILDLYPGYSYEQAGHDLFLTREGHGTGFWDLDIGQYGDILAKYAEGIKSCQPYIGDDNLIYMGE